MANKEHLEILKQGVEVWNRWREENPGTRPDLRGADLHEAYLSRVDLRGAHLRGAHLNGAHLGGADLREANLRKTDLCEANLREANLSRAELNLAALNGAALNGAHLIKSHLVEAKLRKAVLSEADLSGADLGGADLSGAYLHGTDLIGVNLSGAELSRADFSQAKTGYTVFVDLDLSLVEGLETIQHRGPSFIDIHAVYRSAGKIPEAFLRGAGVPDNFIAYIASLTGEAIQYYSCFISYSSQDDAFARRLHADLQQEGVRCWFAPEDIRGGEKLYDQIDQAIRLHDKLLLVLSDHSIHSEWVTTEIRRARKAEAREGQRKLFPIRLVDWETLKDWECLDADAGKDLAAEVREYFIPDFSHWKDHDSYQQAFDRLLRDLKASEA
jgi:hypothetical protein